MNISFETSDIVTQTKQLINDTHKAVDIAALATSWNEIFTPLDIALDKLNQFSSINSHLISVRFTEKFNAEYEQTLPLLSSFYSTLGTNTQLYKSYKGLESHDLNYAQQYILTKTLQEFELSGVHLSKQKQEQYKILREELSVLSNNFAKNALQATTSYKEPISKEELDGVPEHDLALLIEDGKYYLNLNHPSYIAVMTYCKVRSTREKLYRAYIMRASHIDDFDNLEILNTILTKRQVLAELLGFKNYAEYSLATKMVETPEDVEKFILELIHKSKSKATEELAELKEFVSSFADFATHSLQHWDYLFYSEKLKKAKYGIDSELLKEYFPFKKVLDGLLHIIAKLYSLEYTVENTTHYNEELKIIRFSQNNTLVGEILLDPFSRPHKRSGAWMSDYKGLNTPINQTPLAFVVCNASKPSLNVPSLFSFDDVVTLFHEFGHALHHILTTTPYSQVAGINGVPWDGVELPSQYMEFFAYEKEHIKLLSGHYQTGEVLSDEMIECIIGAKNFHAALMTLRQCEFALWDIRTHMSKEDTYKVLDNVREMTALLPQVEHNYFLNSFGHIFAGGYAAGYYSYKWAEVMAADAYSIISKNSLKAEDFKTHILEVGGSRDFLESYLLFSEGRTPSIDALLNMSDIS